MSLHSLPHRGAGLRARLAALAAAVTVVVSIVSALVLVLHGVPPERWLAPSLELMEMAANCDRQAVPAARDHCRQSVVAARLAQARGAVKLAQS